MRTFTVALSAVISILVGSAFAADIPVEKTPYPGDLAMSEERPGVWIYKSFPTFQPIYIFEGEPEGKSSCDEVCAAVWPIIRANNNAQPMGYWTIIDRPDGRKQWAFKGKPVYMYFEDKPAEPRGAGKEQEWYADEAGIAYLIKAGVNIPPDFKPPARKPSDHKIIAKVLIPKDLLH